MSDRTVGPRPSEAWAGWIAFAGVTLALVGTFAMMQGLVALFKDETFVVRENSLVVLDYTGWGIVMLIWGAIQLFAGFGLLSGRTWARLFAILVAFISAFTQIAFLSAQPIWAAIIIALDVFVIFALTVRWQEAQSALHE